MPQLQPEPWMRSCCYSLPWSKVPRVALQPIYLSWVGFIIPNMRSYHTRPKCLGWSILDTQAARVVASDKDFTQIATEATVHLIPDAKISWLNHLLVPSKTARGRRFLGISHLLLKNHWSWWNRYQKLDPAINLYNYHNYKQCQFKESPKGHHKFVRKIGLRTSPEMVTWRSRNHSQWNDTTWAILSKHLSQQCLYKKPLEDAHVCKCVFLWKSGAKKIPIFPY